MTGDEHPHTLAIQGRDLPSLIITEIMFDPKSSELAWEWLELYNASTIYLTNLAANNQDGGNWALSQAGAATPLGDGYTSAYAGGNSGGDIGSPRGSFPATVNTITYTLETDATTIREGNNGSQQLTFTVSRSGATHLASQVDFGSDYDNLGGSSGANGTSGTVNLRR